jgi:hypothetical protein
VQLFWVFFACLTIRFYLYFMYTAAADVAPSCILFFGMQLLQHHAFVALLSQYALHGYRYPFLISIDICYMIYEYVLFA